MLSQNEFVTASLLIENQQMNKDCYIIKTAFLFIIIFAFVTSCTYGKTAVIPTIEKTDTIPEIEMVYIEGGIFTMGCIPGQEDDCSDLEMPAHQVTLDNYHIGKYEVTQKQWIAIMGDNPSYFEGEDRPVEQVSFNDVQEFINKLNAKTGKQYRLPTEAEWEYAARGGNKSKGYKYSGSDMIDNVAWFNDNSEEKTHPVGLKSPNELGIYDMNGNVWEWCNDGFEYYDSSAKVNPQGSTTEPTRVIRGCSWYSNTYFCSCIGRSGALYPNIFDRSGGFRLAMSTD